MSEVEKLDLRVEWPTYQQGMPKIIVGEYDTYADGENGEIGLYQAVEMIIEKINELIESSKAEKGEENEN